MKKRIGLFLDSETIEKIKSEATRNHRKFSTQFELLLKEQLKEMKKIEEWKMNFNESKKLLEEICEKNRIDYLGLLKILFEKDGADSSNKELGCDNNGEVGI